MKRHAGPLLVIALCFVQVALVLLNVDGMMRVASGLLFVTFLPGYALLGLTSRAYSTGIDRLERAILSLPLSLAIVVTLGLVFNTFGLSTRSDMQVLWLSLLTVEMSVLGIALTREDAESEGASRYDIPGITIISIAAAIGLSLGGIATLLDVPSNEPVARLWVLDETGEMTHLPHRVMRDQPFPVTIGVGFDGDSQGVFVLRSPDGRETPIRMQPGETWEWTTRIALSEPGMQQVTWILSIPDGSLPDHRVALWVEVE